METAERHGETSLHRRGQTLEGAAHEEAPGLQVPAQEETQGAGQGQGQVLLPQLSPVPAPPQPPPRNVSAGPPSSCRFVLIMKN